MLGSTKNIKENYFSFTIIHLEIFELMGFWGFGVLGFWGY